MGRWVCFYLSFFLFHSPSNGYSCAKLLGFISRCFGISELNVPQINDGGAAEHLSIQNRRYKNKHQDREEGMMEGVAVLPGGT